ncbi:TonB-dependent receptor [Aestuariicella hydrocarbonica]|uniref:TonB-dependent receptor n=1 Tax=Pseudomaricurvus hydrocarbonicus TaxID=1470433 RepID=A0A9E5T3S2_9GAMM|nr:TonB-dependent receptor [Aestuariicella hydrocarbonica]NHO67413.1 TonB-dependent receptor [Aestuariicella hydrocarbonica]
MESIKYSTCILLACNALTAVGVSAGNTIEEVVVSASRTNKPITAIPNTVKIIDRDALEAQLALNTSLLDGLSFMVPSLTPAHQKMTSNGVTLRGRTPLYMSDGVPQSTPLRNGERSGYTVDPAFIERVEVIYGANAIQGVGATGGVINYVTLDAPENGDLLQKFSAKLTTDNFEDDGLHYRVAGIVGKKVDNKDIVLGVAHDVQDLYHDGNGDPVAIDPIQGDTMDSRSWNVFLKGGLDLDEDQRLEATGNYFKLEGDGDYRVVTGDMLAGIPATSESGQEDGDPTYNKATNVTMTYSHSNLLDGELTLQGFYYDFYALYGGGTFPAFQDPSIAANGTLFDQSALSSEKYGTKLTYVRDNTFWEGLQVAAGLDYLHDKTYQELAQTGRIWVPEMIYKGWAPFVQLEQRLVDDRLRISMGARFENVELEVPDFTTVAGANSTSVAGGEPSFEELLGNFGVVFDLTEELTLFASYAEGFTMPDAGLILRGVNTADQSIDSLIDLQPVVADNIEVGANFRRGGLDLAASYFWSDSDLGSRILVVDGIGELTRQKTEIEGLEITASYRFDSGIATGLGYSQLDGRFDSDGDGAVDKDLDGRNIAPDRINLYVEAPFATDWYGRLQFSRLLDRDFDGGLPQHDFEGYDLLDALVSFRDEELGKFTLGIENLLNEEYITYYSQTLTYVNDSTYFAGRGRAVSLGWEKAF